MKLLTEKQYQEAIREAQDQIYRKQEEIDHFRHVDREMGELRRQIADLRDMIYRMRRGDSGMTDRPSEDNCCCPVNP